MSNSAALVLLRLVVCGGTKETPHQMKRCKILSEGENCFKCQTKIYTVALRGEYSQNNSILLHYLFIFDNI